jgi:predicted transcriptional regulator
LFDSGKWSRFFLVGAGPVMVKLREVGGRRVGELEAQILEVLWCQHEPIGARELLSLLPGQRRAYTTVVTVLTRLATKGLVERVGDGRRFYYRAAADADQLTAQAIEELLKTAHDQRAVLTHLVSSLADASLVAELAWLVKEASS